MAMSPCARIMKYFLVGFNVLILLACAAGIGVGAWALASDYGAEEMEAITGSELYLAGCIVIIIGAVIIAIISFLGCCGAYMENTIMLSIYFVVMLLFLILFVVVAVMGFFFKDDVEDELGDRMKETLTESYGTNDDDDDSVTAVWDKIQKELHCCGVRGDLKSDQSWFLWQSSRWFQDQKNKLIGTLKYVPESCCNPEFSLDACRLINSIESQPIQTSIANITEKNPALYDKGCVTELKDKIEEHVLAIGIIAVIVLIIMTTCIIFAVCVCAEARREMGKQ